MNFEDFASFTGGPPVEPSSGARQVAAAVFDVFVAFRDAGFTEAQALQLVSVMITRGCG